MRLNPGVNRSAFQRYEWIGTLCFDAAQELESQSGTLWCQWMTGRESHVRVFVTGKMGPRELDSMIEMLKLSRSHMAEESDPGELPAPPVSPAQPKDQQ